MLLGTEGVTLIEDRNSGTPNLWSQKKTMSIRLKRLERTLGRGSRSPKFR